MKLAIQQRSTGEKKSVTVPKILEPAFDKLKRYEMARRKLERAGKSLAKDLTIAHKSDNLMELGDVGFFLSRLHMMEARFFYEKMARLDEKSLKKR